MSEPPVDAADAPPEIFTLKVATPVRALGIAAVAAVVGAGLWVLAGVADLPLVFEVIGAVIFLLALSLALAAGVLSARRRTTVKVDPQQVTVSDGPGSRSLSWSEINEVTLKGRRLVLGARADATPDLVVRCPRSVSDPTFRALLVSVQRHLDADRGYSSLA